MTQYFCNAESEHSGSNILNQNQRRGIKCQEETEQAQEGKELEQVGG